MPPLFQQHLVNLKGWSDLISAVAVTRDPLESVACNPSPRTLRRNIRKCQVLGYMTHLSFLNNVADCGLARALVASHVYNVPDVNFTVMSLFQHLLDTFKICSCSDYYSLGAGCFNRGQLLFFIARCIQLKRGSLLALVLIYTVACRLLGFACRLVGRFVAPDSSWTRPQVSLWCEVYDTSISDWIKACFATKVFGTQKLTSALQDQVVALASNHVPANINWSLPSTGIVYKNYTTCQRDNKFFVYSTGPEINVLAIITSPRPLGQGPNPLRSGIVAEFGFEPDQHRKAILAAPLKKHPGNKDDWIFGCNTFGILRALGSKYIPLWPHNYGSVCATLDEWAVSTIDKINAIINERANGKMKRRLGVLALLDRAEDRLADIKMKSAPFPTTRLRYKNHPLYVLESQIGSKRILKPGVNPVTKFRGEAVYLVSDLERLASRSAWHKENRELLPDVQPFTYTSTFDPRVGKRVKVALYKESQTRLCEPDEFVDQGATSPNLSPSRIKSIDLSGKRLVPKGGVYIKGNIDLLQKVAARIRCTYARANSKYALVAGSYKPIYDGIVIPNERLDEFLKQYTRVVEAGPSSVADQDLKNAQIFWRSVFKSILSEPSTIGQSKRRKIKHELDCSVQDFLNQIEANGQDTTIQGKDSPRAHYSNEYSTSESSSLSNGTLDDEDFIADDV